MTRGSEAMTWRGATSFGTGMTRGSEAMTWRDDVDRKKGIRNLECFGGSVLGLGCLNNASIDELAFEVIGTTTDGIKVKYLDCEWLSRCIL
jgi:hypothetical protein